MSPPRPPHPRRATLLPTCACVFCVGPRAAAGVLGGGPAAAKPWRGSCTGSAAADVARAALGEARRFLAGCGCSVALVAEEEAYAAAAGGLGPQLGALLAAEGRRGRGEDVC
jgi:hypothetical protein